MEAWALGYGKKVLSEAAYQFIIHRHYQLSPCPLMECYPQGALEELALVEISGVAAKWIFRRHRPRP